MVPNVGLKFVLPQPLNGQTWHDSLYKVNLEESDPIVKLFPNFDVGDKVAISFKYNKKMSRFSTMTKFSQCQLLRNNPKWPV